MAGSEPEVQGQGKGSLINEQVGNEVPLRSEQGIHGGSSGEDEEFKDVRAF